MKTLFITAVLLAIVATSGAADKYAADWMTYGAGARALGMGGAFVAVADDATSPYWNPAGMPGVERAGVSAMHSYTFGGLAAYDSVFGAYNFGDFGAVGGGVLMCAVDDIPITEWDDPLSPNRRPVLKGYGNSADYAIYGSYGRKVLPQLNVGANAIFLYGDHDFENAGSSGFAFDVAALAGPFGPVTVGLNAQNVFSKLSWDTGTEETIPLNVKLGAAYALPVADWDSEFTFAAGTDVKFAGYDEAAHVAAGEASFEFNGGAEWWYRRTVAVRLGTERSAFAGGVGLATKALGVGFGVDYAYLSHAGLEGSHRASVSFAF
ncbi:MAG: PorV/PorQ family protein [Candidatus Coatesbacteria bacterium]|nr:MAG: PorV/PorQ family protein [Candidatus Coatesbacteria bacterium]